MAQCADTSLVRTRKGAVRIRISRIRFFPGVNISGGAGAGYFSPPAYGRRKGIACSRKRMPPVLRFPGDLQFIVPVLYFRRANLTLNRVQGDTYEHQHYCA